MGKATVILALVLLWVWSTFAILYSNLPGGYLRAGAALAFGLGVPVAVLVAPKRAWIPAFLVGVLLILFWWLSIDPSNDRDWTPDQAVLPYAEIAGEQVTIHHIRNCVYRSTDDYDVHYYDKTFDLGELESVYYVVELFAGVKGAAHTFLSFGFAGDNYVAISVEIRKEKGEAFSAWKGLFKQYEIMYVIGDERDLIKLRSNYRLDEVFVYPIRASRPRVRELFLDMLARANRLREHPEFYNTVTSTCTTNILAHLNRVAPQRVPYHLKVLFPAYSDQLAFELGLIDTDMSLEEARQRYRITERARAPDDSPEFSARIRSDR